MIYRLYSCLIATPLFVLVTVLVGITVSLTSMLGLNKLAHRIIPMLWGKSACVLFLLDVKVMGREKLDPNHSYIFLANHQGYFDILLMYGYLGHSFKWMMKEYLKKMPIVGITCICAKQIFVGDSMTSIQNAIIHSRKTLRDGMSMAIFPEGTRSNDGRMGTFKRGAFMLANEIGLPLVPITINGSYKALNRHSCLVSRSSLSLIVHDPIMPEHIAGKSSKVIMKEVYDVMERDLIVE